MAIEADTLRSRTAALAAHGVTKDDLADLVRMLLAGELQRVVDSAE